MGEGFDAGTAAVTLKGIFEEHAFNRYDRAVKSARAQPDVTKHLKIDADTKGVDRYDRALKDVNKSHADVDKGARSASGGIGLIGRSAAYAAGPAALYGLYKVTKLAFGAFKESERVAKQTEAVLKSTGGAAGLTAKQVNSLANEISAKTGVDDEAIQSGENLLLTFTNVRNEVGKGNDVFTQATKVAVDMSAALGQDLKSSNIQLGKALNDPIKGVTALQRVGVSFTASQKDQIKGLVEHGKTLDAQKLILGELTKEFGGSAEATATSSKKLGVTFGNLAEGIGRIVSPAIEKASDKLNTFVTGIVEGDGAGGKFIDTTKRIASAVTGGLGSAFDFIGGLLSENSDTISSIGDGLERLVGRAVGLFSDLGAAFKQTFGASSGTGKDIHDIVRAVFDLLDVFVKVADGLQKRFLPGIEQALKGVLVILRGVIRVISGLLHGDFSKMWDGIKDIFRGGFNVIIGIARAGAAPLRLAFTAIWSGITSGAEAAWRGIEAIVKGGLRFIAGGASSLLGIIADVVDTASHLPFVGGKFKGLANDIRGAQRDIDAYRASLRKTNDEHEKTPASVKKHRDAVDLLRARLSTLKKGTHDYDVTAGDLRIEQGKLNTAMSNAQGAGKRGAKGLSALADAADAASDGVGSAMDTIASNVNSLAKELGAKGITFKVAKTSKGRRTQNNVFGPIGGFDSGLEGKQRGGWIGNKGMAGADDQLILAANGEAVVNRHQVPIIDSALQAAYGMSIDDMFATYDRPHGFAQGGIVGKMIRLGHAIQKRGPYHVGENPAFGGVAPVHAHYPPYDHYSGGALDINADGAPGGEKSWLDKLAAWLRSGGWHVLWQVKDHFDHLHVDASAGGAVGAGGAGGGTLAKLAVSGPAGALKSIVQGAASRMTTGGNKFLNGKVPTEAGEPSPSGGKGKYSFASLRSLWTRAGGSPSMASLMAHVALAESGGDPNAANPSGATGLWQILGSIIPGNLRNPLVNARNAVAKLASQGLGAWAASRGAWGQFVGKAARGKHVGGKAGKRKGKKAPDFGFADAGIESSASNAFVLKSLKHDNVDRVSAIEGTLENVDDDQRTYGQLDRRFNLTTEDFVDPDTGELDAGAIQRRGNELASLGHVRRRILDGLIAARKELRKVIATYQAITKRIRGMLTHTKGKPRAALRGQLKHYSDQLSERQSQLKDMNFDVEDARLDWEDLNKEYAELVGTKASPKTGDVATDDSGSVDTGGDTGGLVGLDTSTPAATAPSPEDIARAAAEQLSAFNSQRADAFAQFGSNFVTAGAQRVADASVAAAGSRYYGAFTSGDEGGAAGGRTIIVQKMETNFPEATPDPHTYSRLVVSDLEAAG